MKNFPDQDQFGELEKRLQGYAEQPDELVWENIDAALRPNRTWLWLPWVDRAASVISVLMCVWAISSVQFSQSTVKQNVGGTDHSFKSQLKKDEMSLKGQEQKEMNATDEHDDIATSQPGAERDLDREVNKLVHPQVALIYKEEVQPPSDTAILRKNIDNDGDSAEIPVMNVPVDSLRLNAPNQVIVNQTKRIPKRKPAFYASVTPSLSFQRAIPVGSDEIIVKEFYHASILSAERFGFSIASGVQGFLTKRFEYYGGLTFYHQNQILKYSYQPGNKVDVVSDGDNNYVVTPKSLMGSVNYKMINLGAHVGVLYNLYGKTLTHKIGGGLQYQQGFKKSGEGAYENSESTYFSYQVFYRNEVNVGPRLRIFIQPVFTQSIRVNEKSEAPFNLKPYHAGIGFGILYDF